MARSTLLGPIPKLLSSDLSKDFLKDLTPLLAEYQGPLAQPIIAAAGSDISFWFDEATGQPVSHVDPVTQMKEVYCPWGRYIHVPPQGPESAWGTDFSTPWWDDTPFGEHKSQTEQLRRFWIGLRSAATRKICIMSLGPSLKPTCLELRNLLTRQKNTLEAVKENRL